MTALLVFVILGGHLAAPYIADPASIPRPWLYIVAVVASVATFAAVATLTVLAYSIRFLRFLPAAKRFFSFVGNYSAVGAVAGTVLGLRMAGPLLIHNKNFGFADLMSETGNTITMLTLLMVALCWPYAWGPVLAISRAERATSAVRRMPAATLAFPVLIAGNLGGLYSAAAMWRILTS
jgi:hypothetical protein